MLEFDPEVILRYRRILRMVAEGSTEGERTAAQNAAHKMEEKHPGIAEALASLEKFARETAKKEAVRKAGYHVPSFADSVPGWFPGLLRNLGKKAVDAAVDRIVSEFNLPLDVEDIMSRIKKPKEECFSDKLKAWDASEGLVNLEVEPTWLEDDDEAELFLELAFTRAFWIDVLKHPEEFLNYIDQAISESQPEDFDGDEDEDLDDEEGEE